MMVSRRSYSQATRATRTLTIEVRHSYIWWVVHQNVYYIRVSGVL